MFQELTFCTVLLTAFAATLCGTPILLTLTTAAAFGLMPFGSALSGIALASFPLYLLGTLVTRLGFNLPKWVQKLAHKAPAPAAFALITPFWVFWVCAPVVGFSLTRAATGALTVTLPVALVTGGTTLLGAGMHLPGWFTAFLAFTGCVLFITLRKRSRAAAIRG